LLVNQLNINSPDAVHRQEAIDAVKAGIDQGEELGAPGCALLSGADPGNESREEGLDLLVDSLRQLCDYAGGKSMDIVLETFDRLPFGKNCIIGPNALAVEVSNRLRREYPNFGLMLDLSHFPLQGEGTAYSLNIARDHIVHMHVGNCVMNNPDHPAYGDNHPRFGCEDGENDVPEVVEFLKELLNIGYLDPEKRPILSFEVAPMAGESSEVIIANAKRVLDEAWAQV
jgi:sugar phosphate isomerase/epimerase